MNRIADIKARVTAATKGPLLVCVAGKDGHATETVEEAAQHAYDHVMAHDSATLYMVAIAEDFTPNGTLVTAITGNGPTSEANAELYCHAPDDLADLVEVAEAAKVYRHCAAEYNRKTSAWSAGLRLDAALAKLEKGR